MLLRPFLYDAGSCASYLFGCTTHNKLAVIDAHIDLVDDYLAAANAIGVPISAVFETHVQAEHVSGLPQLIERTGATAYVPAYAGVEFEHVALDDGDVVEFGNTIVTAIATPGHAPAHNVSQPRDRARIVGAYRFWRAFGFIIGALIAGFGADGASPRAAITIVAALTAASGLWVAATAWQQRRPLRPVDTGVPKEEKWQTARF